MKKLYILCLLFSQIGIAQLSLPHLQNFNSTTSDEGWTHYAISGTDNWERGNATLNSIPNDLSWNTKLNGEPNASSIMVLESPAFDLTDADLPYVLSFRYKAALNQGNLYLEYTLDNGTTWTLLNPDGALKRNWQSTSGFSIGSSSTTITRHPAINLSSLAGEANVKFRFRFKTKNYVNGYGFIIDDFAIQPEYFNIYATVGEPIEISPLCPEIEVKTSLNFDNQYSQYYALETNYYLSTDTNLDDSDTFLGTFSVNDNNSDATYDYQIDTPPNLNPGQYYIVYKHDFADVLVEDNEDDNVSYASLLVKPIFNLPYQTDFETDDINWKANYGTLPEYPIWARGEGTRHQIEGAHSGTNAWHTSYSVNDHPDYTFQSVESPYFNLNSSSDPLVLNFWYKADYPSYIGAGDNEYIIQYQLNCSSYWQELFVIPSNETSDWEYINFPLDESISTNENVRFRVTYHSSYHEPEGIIFDDFYVGPDQPDLSIESLFSNDRYTASNTATDVLKYQLRNSGADISQDLSTNFYWSNDNQLDGSDVLLGSKSITAIAGNNEGQWLEFNYTKPTLVIGDYFIIYEIDPTNSIEEKRENNNIGAIAIKQNAKFSFPYYNDFETETESWYHNSTLNVDEWELSTAQGEILDETFSGDLAFISKPTGSVTPMSRMHLYTPPFDLSSSTNPVLEFDMKLDSFMWCHCFELTLNFSYSIDNGATWTVLNPVNDSFSKWKDILEYDENTGLDVYDGEQDTEKMFAKTETAIANFWSYNSRDIDRNTKYMINIPQLKDETNIRFRFNLSTENNDETSGNVTNNNRRAEGALIDNFQIREAEVDLSVPYTKNLYISDAASKINFSIDVKNTGNYISEASNIKFYLSQDDTYDAGDYLIGENALTAIVPDRKLHQILEYNLPSNLSNYTHLVYVIDDVNTNIEIDETNNSGAFTLGLDGITSYPYVEDFENDIIDGWYGFAYDDIDDATLTNYRVTHRLAITREEDEFRRLFNGMLRTEYVPYGSWQDYATPLYYIKSPVFDFSNSDTSEPLFMAFDIMSVGKSTKNGSNMEYSLDGGNSWTLLTVNSSPTTSNWYPVWQTMSDMYNEPGWRDDSGEVFRVEMDISFLQNQDNVLFRYKYFSNHATASTAPRGFRLDNFIIAGESELNAYLCLEALPYEMSFNNYEAPCWTIDGMLGRNANSTIQWEIVDNFAASDEFSAKIDIVGDNDTDGSWLISPLFNLQDDVTISFNMALTQLGNNNATVLDNDDEIKLLYSTDEGSTWQVLRIWDNTTPISNTGELIEEDLFVTGYTHLAFWASNGVVNDLGESTLYITGFNVEENALSINDYNTADFQYFPNPVTSNLTVYAKGLTIDKLQVYNVSGQLLYTTEPKTNELVLSFQDYASGIYFIKVHSESKTNVFKILKE